MQRSARSSPLLCHRSPPLSWIARRRLGHAASALIPETPSQFGKFPKDGQQQAKRAKAVVVKSHYESVEVNSITNQLYFVKIKVRAIASNNRGTSAGRYPMQILSKYWHTLSAEERKRYAQECEQFNADNGFTKPVQWSRSPPNRSKPRVCFPGLDSVEPMTDQDLKGYIALIRRWKFPIRLSACNVYIREKTAELRRIYPGLPAKDVLRMAVARWRHISPEEYKMYQRKSHMAIYRRWLLMNSATTPNMALFFRIFYPLLYREQVADGHMLALQTVWAIWRTIDAHKKAIFTELHKAITGVGRGRKQRWTEDPFYMFAMLRYRYVSIKNPSWSHVMIMRNLSHTWSCLDPAEKEIVALTGLTKSIQPAKKMEDLNELNRLWQTLRNTVEGGNGDMLTTISEKLPDVNLHHTWSDLIHHVDQYKQTWRDNLQQYPDDFTFLNFYLDMYPQLSIEHRNRSEPDRLRILENRWQELTQQTSVTASPPQSERILTVLPNGFNIFASEKCETSVTIASLLKIWSGMQDKDKEPYLVRAAHAARENKKRATSIALQIHQDSVDTNAPAFRALLSELNDLIYSIDQCDHQERSRARVRAWEAMTPEQHAQLRSTASTSAASSSCSSDALAENEDGKKCHYRSFVLHYCKMNPRVPLARLIKSERILLASKLWKEMPQLYQKAFERRAEAGCTGKRVIDQYPIVSERIRNELLLVKYTAVPCNTRKRERAVRHWTTPLIHFRCVNFQPSPFLFYCFKRIHQEQGSQEDYSIHKVLENASFVWGATQVDNGEWM